MQVGQQDVWNNRDMLLFPCPASAAALCPALSPELHPSSAAEPELCCKDTHSLADLSYVLHRLRGAASLQTNKKMREKISQQKITLL